MRTIWSAQDNLLATLIMGLLVGALSAGIAVTSTITPQTLTLTIAVIVAIIVLSEPIIGIIIALPFLYFPLLPNVPLGSLTLSATTVPLLVAAFNAFTRVLWYPSRQFLSRWQTLLIIALLIGFLSSIVTSVSITDSVLLLPNLILYVATVFALMVLIERPAQLVWLAKMEIVLALLISLWRIEFRSIRHMFGFPSFGTNGPVFYFHAAFAITVIIVLISHSSFSRLWRIIAGITLVSLVYHGVAFETRGAWLAWSIILLILFSRLALKNRAKFTILLVGGLLVLFNLYGDVISQNIQNTELIASAINQGEYSLASGSGSGDEIRLRRQEYAWRLFVQRPLTGWGPATYADYASQLFNTEIAGSAFNSWLQSLTQLGLIGTLPALVAYTAPIVITWRALGKNQDSVRYLCFAFALGTTAIAIHLLFISLMYSFAWFHAGLGLAAARISVTSPAVAQPVSES